MLIDLERWLKSAMINEGRYEEAAKINRCIEDEYNKLKNNNNGKRH